MGIFDLDHAYGAQSASAQTESRIFVDSAKITSSSIWDALHYCTRRVVFVLIPVFQTLQLRLNFSSSDPLSLLM